MLGTVVGKYKIVGQLGRGATGIVYKAVDDTLGREVALKILNPAHTDPEILKRFRVEATVLARLNHPGIATIYDLVQSETELLMVMELVRGETLECLSERLGPLPPDRAAYLADGVLSALEHAHRAGVVHRDMKPTNVMVTELGLIKVMDFGVARARGAEHITMDGYLVGTPAYMSPEQVLGHKVDERADLYSVGVMFYRLLTRALPFTADTAVGMLQQQISNTPNPLRLHREDLPEWCEAIVQRALAKSPDDRFPSAGSFREALARASGIVMTPELGNGFSVVENGPVAEPAPPVSRTLAISHTEAGFSVADSASVIAMALRNRPRASLVVFAAIVAVLASVPLQDAKTVNVSAEPLPAATAPVRPVPVNTSPVNTSPVKTSSVKTSPASTQPASTQPANTRPTNVLPAKASLAKTSAVRTVPHIVFETKALVALERTPRERGARLVLSDRNLTVMANGETHHALHSVPYDSIVSIAYSRSQDPMWNSPKGPAPVTRVQGGAARMLGLSVQRHWVAVRTNTETRFVILRFEDAQIRKVLSALEERTGRAPRTVGKPTGT